MAFVIFPEGIHTHPIVGEVGFEGHSVNPPGILSEGTVGAPTLNSPGLSATGISSSGTVGTPTLLQSLSASSIPNTAKVGTPSLTGGTTPVPEPPYVLTHHNQPRPLTLTEQFSDAVVDQSVFGSGDFLSLEGYDAANYTYYQEFLLPNHFTRGSFGATTQRTPELSGFQVLVGVDPDYQDAAALDWIIERQQIGVGWETLLEGTTVGTHTSGDKLWMDVYFESPLEIQAGWLSDRFRFGVRGRQAAPNGTINQLVPYQNGVATISGEEVKVRLVPEAPYHFIFNDIPSSLLMDSAGKVYYSEEQGVNRIWISTPNPLVAEGNRARDADGNALTVSGVEGSFLFRILAAVADDGQDHLGNTYRSVVARRRVDDVTVNDIAAKEAYWQSKPNPSRFGVESIYFDIQSDLEEPQTVNRVLLDPLTPGLYANFYYSNEEASPSTSVEWEELLWTPVPDTYRLEKRDAYALPEPVTARFMKIEFSNLQARAYEPGNFPKPIVYKKFPKWVLDYYLMRFDLAQRNTEDFFISRRTAVTYDSFDLAYSYYLDDLAQEPLEPGDLGYTSINEIKGFLTEREDASDQIDVETLLRINEEFRPYQGHPAVQAKWDFLLSQYTIPTAEQGQVGDVVVRNDYPVERPAFNALKPNNVSRLRRDDLVIEKTMPIMRFFVESRHRYRTVIAPFTHNRAYFAGIKEVAFLRDHFASTYDASAYPDLPGDNANAERNDFVLDDLVWRTYSEKISTS